jgi:pentose-5-phosphate-3-epimerase
MAGAPARQAVDAGANVLVSASGIFQARDPAESARTLRAIANEEAV